MSDLFHGSRPAFDGGPNLTSSAHLARRRRTAAALCAAAACSSLWFAGSASAQTWVNPNVGSWSVGTNWTGGAAPASSTSTKLKFNATGAQTYSAFNNIATPFILNSIDLNNSGTGTITLNGNSLSLGGTTPAINTGGSGYSTISNAMILSANVTLAGTGTGTTTLAGVISSSPAATGTAGNSLIIGASGSSSANVGLSGGGTIYSIRANIGNTFITGGSYSLTSTQHGNDVFGGIADAGNWSTLIGDTSGQTGNLTMTGGTIAGQNLFAGNVAGSVGVATFSGASTVVTLPATLGSTNGLIGTNFGTGTINVLSGANLTGRRMDLGRQNGGVGNLLVSGTNSKVTLGQEIDVGSGLNSVGRATIAAGGQVTMSAGQAFVGSAFDNIGNPATTTGTATVTGANSLLNVGGDGTFGAGQLMIGFGSGTATSAGTLSVQAGGRVNSFNIYAGQASGTANIRVDGTNSLLANGNQFLMESQPLSTLSITNGGQWTNGGAAYFASNPTDNVAINIGGGGALANLAGANNFSVLSGGGGGGAPGGTTTLTISAGGEYRSPVVYAADAINSRTTINVSGAAGKLTTDQLYVANDTGAAGTINISGGGTVSASGLAVLSSASNSRATLNVIGAGSSYDGSAVGSQLQIGTGTTGAGTFSVTSGAVARVNSLAQIYEAGRLVVGGASAASGGTFTAGQMAVQGGRVQYNAGTLNITGALSIQGGGAVLLSGAQRTGGTPANKKVLEVGSIAITGVGTIDLSDNDMIVHASTLAAIQTSVKNAYDFGSWDQPGITSSAAKNDPQGVTTLGVMSGAEFANNNGGTFNGRSPTAADVLVKYTYFGDVDFNGAVDSTDYNLIDFGYLTGASGWANGDVDYSGAVDSTDYNLIDFAFVAQGGALARAVRVADSMLPSGDSSWIVPAALTDGERIVWEHGQLFGPAYVRGFLDLATPSVPEPAWTGIVMVTCGALAWRKRKPFNG